MFISQKGMVSTLKPTDFLRNELGMVSTLTLFFLEGFSMVSTLTLFFLEGFSMVSTKMFFKKA
jgi:hypothetical protein